MNDYRGHDRDLTARRWWAYLKYGALIALTGITVGVVFLALTK